MSIMWTVALGILAGVLGIIGAFAASHPGQEAGWYQAEDSTGLFAAVFGAVVLLLI